MRNGTEKLQHRRHRPVYLAPTAVHLQHYSSKSYDSGEDIDNEKNDSGISIEDLRIPLFVQIPQNEILRLPVTSPPCSDGSSVSISFSPAVHRTERERVRWQSAETNLRPSPLLSFRESLHRLLSRVYLVVSDFVLLIMVCVMGLFFHVEVEVVEQRVQGRRGRVVVQQSHNARTRHRQYQSTDLLRPLNSGSPSSSLFRSDDVV
mmetsp:Transcript_7275/g.17742  ORF Transcript_7275/g.17742 Transcript_7275/m.17742 type:complete len:205 (+) Transcript_7275:330-944(+)